MGWGGGVGGGGEQEIVLETGRNKLVICQKSSDLFFKFITMFTFNLFTKLMAALFIFLIETTNTQADILLDTGNQEILTVLERPQICDARWQKSENCKLRYKFKNNVKNFHIYINK